MSCPFRVQRKNGACYGTLLKQHTSVTVPSNLLCFTNDNGNIRSTISRTQSPSLLEKSSTALADKNTVTAALDGNERAKSHEFCVLVGNTLISFENLTAFRRGDQPTSEVRIVGASAWNPLTTKIHNASLTPPMNIDKLSENSSYLTTKNKKLFRSTTFQLVTYAGTHIYCSAETTPDRNIWLSALHAGLELSYSGHEKTLSAISTYKSNTRNQSSGTKDDEMREGLDHMLSTTLNDTILMPPLPQREARTQVLHNRISRKHQYVHSPGVVMSPSNSSHGKSFQDPYSSDPTSPLCVHHCLSCGRFPPENAMPSSSNTPLPQYGFENRVNVCKPCLVAQGMLRHVRTLVALYGSDAHERAAFTNARDLVVETVKNLVKRKQRLEDEGGKSKMVEEGERKTDVGGDGEIMINSGNKILEYTPCTDIALLQLIQSEEFAAYRCRSSVLDANCCIFESNGSSVHTDESILGEVVGNNTSDRIVDFLEKLNECANNAVIPSLFTSSCNGNDAAAVPSGDETEMKKQALKVAGDMGAAIKLLHEHALNRCNNVGEVRFVGRAKKEMLAYILEFFLDLCEEGKLSSFAFFWSQLCQIHLQMLPPLDTDSLVRVELMEDFLLTVSVRYSVHLALELVWNCISDLEDSLGSTSNVSSASCQRRRFALLRFVCELESLIFDFDGGWGGGSISVRSMLIPSDHQAELLRDAMSVLQLHRRFSCYHLTRSVRLEKLCRDVQKEEKELRRLGSEGGGYNDHIVVPRLRSESTGIACANRKYHMARNAEYYSTQLMFTRRLGDIAESLFHLDVQDRPTALKRDLEALNTSGRLGGDPLNKIFQAEHGLVNVLHIPSTEGHVFRSKDRTPVLLLMEVIKDETIIDTSTDSSATGQKFEVVQTPNTNGDLIHFLSASAELEMGRENFVTSNICGKTNENGNVFNSTSVPAKEEKDLNYRHDVIAKDNESSSHRNKVRKKNTTKRNIAITPDNVCDMENLVARMMEHQLNLEIPGLSKTSQDIIDFDELKYKILYRARGDEGLEAEEDVMQSYPDRKEGQDEESSPNINPTIRTFSLDRPTAVLPKVKTWNDCSEDLSTSDCSTATVQRNKSILDSLGSRFGRTTHNGDIVRSSFGPHGEGRRKVLTTMFVKGMKSNNLIARGVAPVARRAVQAMDHQRAVKLIQSTTTDEDNSDVENDRNIKGASSEKVTDFKYLGPQTIDEDGDAVFSYNPTEEDECMESLRLLLIQNRVAQGNLSAENATQTLACKSKRINRTYMVKQNVASSHSKGVSYEKSCTDEEQFNAGEIDERLVGCSTVSEAVINALKLWKDNVITNGELLEFVHKDLKYARLSLPGAINEDKLREDSAFWGRFAFGERWAEKKARIQASSKFGSHPGWDLIGIIVKANDDVRQEAFVMQLIMLCEEVFNNAGLELWIQPYRILATGRTTGIIEMVKNAMSFDSLKKRPGFNSGGLLGHLKRMTEFAADPKEAFKIGKQNFVRSLATYSLLSYIFMFKDRHNGNLLLDTAGHVIHIDFGFVFGTAPGGSFSLEQSAPFKLTDEMLEVMDGLGSPLFSEFVTLFCCGFLALQANAETFLTMIQITCEGSTFKCFDGKSSSDIITKLCERFCLQLDREGTIAYVMELIKQATNSYGTKHYDYFQYISQGIAA